jgi:hypothetical protein
LLAHAAYLSNYYAVKMQALAREKRRFAQLEEESMFLRMGMLIPKSRAAIRDVRLDLLDRFLTPRDGHRRAIFMAIAAGIEWTIFEISDKADELLDRFFVGLSAFFSRG